MADYAGEAWANMLHVCRETAGQLKEGDTVSVVGWNEFTYTLLDSHEVTGPDDATLLATIDALEMAWGTDLFGGLSTAYELTELNMVEGQINRVMLISDGRANLGETDAEVIGTYAGEADKDGIYLIGVGTGEIGHYNDTLMDSATDIGLGAALYTYSTAEVERWFGDGDRFVSLMGVAARDVTVELTLPPGFEIVAFSGESYSTVPEEVRPQNLAPNDSMVLHQVLSTCDPDSIDDSSEIQVTATWLDAITFEPQSLTLSTTFGELLARDTSELRKGAAIFAYAEALQAWKHGDDDTRSAANATWRLAQKRAEEALPKDPDLEEIRSIMGDLMGTGG